jgi:ribonuclease P protein component
LRSGKRYSTKSLVLQSKAINDSENELTPRVGYTVTRKVGNAIIRNRIKRRLREAANITFPLKSQVNHDYVIIGKHGALTQNFTSILKDLEQALDHVHRNGAKGSRKN